MRKTTTCLSTLRSKELLKMYLSDRVMCPNMFDL